MPSVSRPRSGDQPQPAQRDRLVQRVLHDLALRPRVHSHGGIASLDAARAVLRSCAAASALATTILAAFAIAVNVLANPRTTLPENQNAAGPEALAGSVWLGAALTVAVLL